MSNTNTERFRIYTVISENGVSRQYLTDLENQLRDYPFRGYLISYRDPFSGSRPLKIGEVVQVSDNQGKKIRTGFPLPAKVLDISEVSESQVSSVYRPSAVRIYCLDRAQGRCVVATDNENLVYSMPFPSGLFDMELGSFTGELLDVGANVSIRPIFGGRYEVDGFCVKKIIETSLNEYKALQRTFKKEVQESEEAHAAISRNFGQRIYEHEVAIKALVRERDAAIRNAGKPPCLDEVLFRAFEDEDGENE